MVKFDSIIDINDDIIPFITDGKVENFKSQLLQNGDVILADTAEDKTTGKAVEITGISEKYYAVSGLHTMIGRPNIQFAPKFLGYYLNCLSYRKQLLKLMQGIKVFSLSKSSVAKTEISFPKKVTEQQQIGAFFDTLNRTITLHQRKLINLNAIKKLFLLNLFPGSNSVNPKIRFNLFSENWQQRKLSEICSIVMGQSPHGETYTNNPNDKILIQGNADLKDGKVIPRIWTNQVTKSALKGDIIISVRAPVGDIAITQYNAVIGRGVAKITGNKFIYYTLMNIKYRKVWKKFSTGSTFDNINNKDLNNLLVKVPNAQEQKNIISFFDALLNSIELTSQKIEMMKKLKKYYISNLFI